MIALGVRAKVQDYIDGVLDGSIVASQRVKDAARRHLEDLKRQNTDDFPYYFDERTATDYCELFPVLIKHSIGEFAGQPFNLEPWQAFIVWQLFGWKRCADGTRRFRKAYISIARKNGKSTFISGLCLILAACDIDPKTGKPESVGQILLTATKKDQAKIVYDEVQRMRKQSRSLLKNSLDRYNRVTFNHNETFITPVSSDKPFDGLNPFIVVMDELHAWTEQHRKFYDTMVTGSGSRSQPLHLIITTAGDDSSHLWLENYNYAVNVTKGLFKDESIFAFIAELDEGDDCDDERVWQKANPNLGVSCKHEYLRQRWNEDKNTAVGRNRFLRYHGNRISTSIEKAFDLVAWDKCVGPLSDWSEADAVGAGADLGARDDLGAFGRCARFKTNLTDSSGKQVYRYEIRVNAFIAETTKRDLSVMPFSEFIYQGFLQRVRFPVEELTRQLIESCKENEISTVAFDPYNGQQLGEALEKEGMVAARMPQNQSNFNEAIRDFLDLISQGRITFESNSLLRWCANNAKIAKDRQDRWMFDKRSSGEKIDPIVAAVMAYRICSLQPERATGELFLM